MPHVLIVCADNKGFSRQFSAIASLCPSAPIQVSELSKERVAKSSLVVVDFQTFSPEQVAFLRNFLKSAPQMSWLCIVNTSDRREVLQAQDVGLNTLFDREQDVAALMAKIREISGNNTQQDFGENCPEQVSKTISSTCDALDLLSISALSNGPLPMPTLARTANDLAKTLASDGLDNWLSAVQNHHSHTFCHTMMVAGHTVSFSKDLGLPEQTQLLMGLGALVHDLGKVKIPLSILDKPGKLTDRERRLINKHPVFSREILSGRKEVPREVAEMAVSHHEMLDGSGYPDGLKGDQISQTVRILTICDIYSALTEKRAYKDSFSPRQAFATMFQMGAKLDRELLKSFRDKMLTTDLGRLRKPAV